MIIYQCKSFFYRQLILSRINRTSNSKISIKVIKLMPKNMPIKPPIEAKRDTLFILTDSVICV